MWKHLVRVRSMFLVCSVLVSSLAACGGLETQKQVPLTPVPITESKAVEGTWEGLVKNTRTGKDSGRVIVVLTFHDTYWTYSFGGETAQGSLVGTGRMTVENGRLSSEMGQRMANFTLCLHGSDKVVIAHVFGKDGNPYYAELTRLK